LACVISANQLHANFHAWQIAEIYSNADGTVQFIELSCDESGETELNGQRLYCSKGLQTNIFTFPSNLSGETLNKRLLLATAGFASLPGGVPANYTLPAHFLFAGSGRVNYASVDALNYSGLPTNGVSSLVRVNDSFVIATNSPRNLAGQSGSIVPVRIRSGTFNGPNFLVSFATATGKNYTVQHKPALTNATWQNVSTVAGNGGIKTVTNTGTASHRFYRLRAQ
jgi:hypothetical protein